MVRGSTRRSGRHWLVGPGDPDSARSPHNVCHCFCKPVATRLWVCRSPPRSSGCQAIDHRQSEFSDGSADTGVWTTARTNATSVTCGVRTRVSDYERCGGSCVCGARLPSPRPYRQLPFGSNARWRAAIAVASDAGTSRLRPAAPRRPGEGDSSDPASPCRWRRTSASSTSGCRRRSPAAATGRR